MELVVRIELTTCSLRMSCSAIEPHQQGVKLSGGRRGGPDEPALLPLTDCYYTIKLGENQEEISVFTKNFLISENPAYSAFWTGDTVFDRKCERLGKGSGDKLRDGRWR